MWLVRSKSLQLFIIIDRSAAIGTTDWRELVRGKWQSKIGVITSLIYLSRKPLMMLSVLLAGASLIRPKARLRNRASHCNG